MTPLEKHNQKIERLKKERDATPYGPHWKDLNRQIKNLERKRGALQYFADHPQK